MTGTRRNLLAFGGGAAAAVAFTPIPWKLLDDVSIWTQNWSWIPPVPRGEITVKHSACTMCGAGCGVQAHCVGGQPFGLAPVAGHPLSHGGLCALAYGAHQMPYHARRLRKGLSRGAEVAPDVALAHAVEILRDARDARRVVAVLDERPGRMVSAMYARLLGGLPGSVYLTPPAPERATAGILSGWAGRPAGFDFEKARTILSIGTPLLDGFGAAGALLALWANREDRVRFLHAEPRQSHTAALADRWIAIRPGSEAAFALGLAGVLVRDGLAKAPAPYGAFSLEEAARRTGLRPDTILAVAHELAGRGPALVIGGGDPVSGPLPRDAEQSIAALNVLLGSEAVCPRHPLPFERPATPLLDVPDGTISVLIADAASNGCALPEAVLRRKLANNAQIIRLSAFQTTAARRADVVVPVAAPSEALEEVTAPACNARAAWGLAPPLVERPEGVYTVPEVVARLAEGCQMPAPGSIDEASEAIQALGRGSTFEFGDASIWTDSEDSGQLEFAALPEIRLEEPSLADGFPLTLMPAGWRGAAAAIPLPPLTTKLYQESELRPGAREARVHPATARDLGLARQSRATAETPYGSAAVSLRFDESVPPGVVEVAAHEDDAARVFALCGDTCWRSAPARLRRS
ncbi:MAG: hypothetical protein IPM24_07630 [Bryobacterales bacterium]|nr:hypothetical protein [Bryobacterales bacterium]